MPDYIANNLHIREVTHPIWLSVSECAKLGGITTKTIRRAIQSQKIKYKIVNNRYLINFTSFVEYMNSSIKLKNKLYFNGLGQYIDNWKLE